VTDINPLNAELNPICHLLALVGGATIVVVSRLRVNREIHELEQGKTYKYLRNEESEGIQHQQMKERLKQEYRWRLRMILKSELNARNKITAIGALAVPVLRYSFGIINWRIEEIKQTDRKTRKMLTMYKMHQPRANIDRLYVKRKE
jgi:hypothetical protein